MVRMRLSGCGQFWWDVGTGAVVPRHVYTPRQAKKDPAMSDHDTPVREYTRPPMQRGVDPQRMNWLWQLILQATDLKPEEVRAALNAMGVGATDQRLASWSVGDRDERYFPLTIAELERNLRAVVAMKQKRAEAQEKPAAPAE
jgi:hypothetical protein